MITKTFGLRMASLFAVLLVSLNVLTPTVNVVVVYSDHEGLFFVLGVQQQSQNCGFEENVPSEILCA